MADKEQIIEQIEDEIMDIWVAADGNPNDEEIEKIKSLHEERAKLMEEEEEGRNGRLVCVRLRVVLALMSPSSAGLVC